jgi:hypothetical protein
MRAIMKTIQLSNWSFDAEQIPTDNPTLEVYVRRNTWSSDWADEVTTELGALADLTSRHGWGNGYILIKKENPHYEKALKQAKPYGYYSIEGQEQETTFTEKTKDGNIVVGFDTCHMYNNSSHNKQWVIEQTLQWAKLFK